MRLTFLNPRCTPMKRSTLLMVMRVTGSIDPRVGDGGDEIL
jgi:hypothetical protein